MYKLPKARKSNTDSDTVRLHTTREDRHKDSTEQNNRFVYIISRDKATQINTNTKEEERKRKKIMNVTHFMKLVNLKIKGKPIVQPYKFVVPAYLQKTGG